MSQQFCSLPAVSLQPRSTFGSRPRHMPIVNLNSPASTVLTDFAVVTPITTTPQTPIDTALRRMKTAGVRLLFVVNDIDEIIGLITTTDIMGERPIKMTQQTRLPRSKLTVASIMTPQTDVQVLDAARIKTATVGDVVLTMQLPGRQHALVARIDTHANTHRVIGMFSISHISKVLGRDVAEHVAPADSLAEIIEKMS